MLKFQDQNETVNAATVRVNPKELVEALRTLEERKAVEAHAQEDTIPLGEAIDALGVHHTPEEVLEALQAYRARQKQDTAALVSRPVRKRTLAPAVGIAVLFSAVLIGAWGYLVSSHDVPSTSMPITIISPAVNASAHASFQMKHLSEIGVGSTFRCDTNTLMRLASGAAGANTMVQVDGEQGDLWTAVRAPTGIEIQGITTTGDALNFANGQEATLYRTSDMFSGSPVTTVQVSLKQLSRNIPTNYSPDSITLKGNSR